MLRGIGLDAYCGGVSSSMDRMPERENSTSFRRRPESSPAESGKSGPRLRRGDDFSVARQNRGAGCFATSIQYVTAIAPCSIRVAANCNEAYSSMTWQANVFPCSG